MEKINKLMTKNTIFIGGIVGVGIAVVIDSLHRRLVIDKWLYKGVAEPLFYISLSLLVTSLFLYFIREDIFRSWLRFAYWWIPLTLIMTYIASGSSGGGFGIPNVFDAEFISLVFSFFFFIISLIIIIYKTVDSLDKKSH